jgi:hypothetical protein
VLAEKGKQLGKLLSEVITTTQPETNGIATWSDRNH